MIQNYNDSKEGFRRFSTCASMTSALAARNVKNARAGRKNTVSSGCINLRLFVVWKCGASPELQNSAGLILKLIRLLPLKNRGELFHHLGIDVTLERHHKGGELAHWNPLPCIKLGVMVIGYDIDF